MKATEKEGKLYIRLDGRIDSANAQEKEQDIKEIISAHENAEPVFDAAELEYISSAGLRVLMRVRKSSDRPVAVINVSPTVYDIFETTGFTEILDVQKALREISLEGCELIGAGGNGDIYRLDKETIVKVYKGVLNSPEKISHNREISRKVFTHGIPSVIPFDMVRVGENYGLIYEMFSGGSLAHYLSTHPDEIEQYGKKIAELLQTLHHTGFSTGELQDARKPYLDDIEYLRKTGWFTDEQADRLTVLIEGIPERNTFIHQDFHPGNIMLMDGELMLIDVDDSGMGHPMLDLMGMYQVYVAAAKTGWTKKMMGLGEEEFTRLWDTFLNEYLGREHSAEFQEINRVLHGYTRIKHIRGVATTPYIPDEVRKPAIEKERDILFEMVDTLYPVPKWL